MAKNTYTHHRRATTIFEDCWNWVLFVKESNDGVEITTIPKIGTVTFTDGYSKNTRKALNELLEAMKMDNKNTPQENNIDEYKSQSRHDDKQGEMFVEIVPGFSKINIMLPRWIDNALIFSKFSTQSENTRTALIHLLNAIEEDNELEKQKRMPKQIKH